MATIVKSNETGEEFVLLGTGFGAFQAAKPNWFFGNLIADFSDGQYAMVCVSNGHGQIGWLQSDEVTVISVDGQPIGSF